jgi:hypothetical protein
MALKLQQLRYAVGVTVKGEAKALYIGPDAGKADAAMAAAGPEFEAVACLPKGVIPTFVRYPAKEATRAKVAAEAEKAREAAALSAKKAEAEAKSAQARKLSAEAAAITKELSKSEK